MADDDDVKFEDVGCAVELGLIAGALFTGPVVLGWQIREWWNTDVWIPCGMLDWLNRHGSWHDPSALPWPVALVLNAHVGIWAFIVLLLVGRIFSGVSAALMAKTADG